MAYTNKYNLPDESRTREILIRRHESIRRSIRPGSLREQVRLFQRTFRIFLYPPLHTHLPEPFSLFQSDRSVPRSLRYYSLQPGSSLENDLLLRRSHGE